MTDGQDELRVKSVYAAREGDPALVAYYRRVGPAFRRLEAERRGPMLAALDALGPRAETRILDVGCGEGRELAWLAGQGFQASHLAGVDIFEPSIEAARQRIPDIDVQMANGGALPFPDGAFDAVIATVVLCTILDRDVRRTVASEMRRVSKGRVMVWEIARGRRFDYEPVSRVDLIDYFGADASVQRISLWMPLASRSPDWLASLLSRFEPLLTHYLVIA